jgi:hypothetical protein
MYFSLSQESVRAFQLIEVFFFKLRVVFELIVPFFIIIYQLTWLLIIANKKLDIF